MNGSEINLDHELRITSASRIAISELPANLVGLSIGKPLY